MRVGGKDCVGVAVLEHDTVTGLEATVGSESQGNLNLKLELNCYLRVNGQG